MPVPNLPKSTNGAAPATVTEILDQVENLIVITEYIATYTRDILKAVSYDSDTLGSTYDTSLTSIDEEFKDIADNFKAVKDKIT